MSLVVNKNMKEKISKPQIKHEKRQRTKLFLTEEKETDILTCFQATRMSSTILREVVQLCGISMS